MLSKETEDWLMTLVNGIDREINLSEENKVLIVLQMNTEEKVDVLTDWVKSKLDNGELKVSEIEVMNKTAEIGGDDWYQIVEDEEE